MKSLFIGCMILFAVTGLSAQTSNAVLFTENGEKFTVILNGLRQNNTPETNVKITGLNAEFYKLKPATVLKRIIKANMSCVL
jgi:archaellum component FlaG (FlaF/FlaG flagellin family)